MSGVPPVSYILNFYITIVQLIISHREHFFISRLYLISFFITFITRKLNFYYPSEYMRSCKKFCSPPFISTKARKLFDNVTDVIYAGSRLNIKC